MKKKENCIRTIGELLSRGDETSMLDSSSWTSPYILPKFIALKTQNKFNPIEYEWKYSLITLYVRVSVWETETGRFIYTHLLTYLFPKCSFSLRPFSFSDTIMVFRAGTRMFRMVLWAVEPVWPFSFSSVVCAFELYDSFCNNHRVHRDSFVQMNLIHCLIRNIL